MRLAAEHWVRDKADSSAWRVVKLYVDEVVSRVTRAPRSESMISIVRRVFGAGLFPSHISESIIGVTSVERCAAGMPMSSNLAVAIVGRVREWWRGVEEGPPAKTQEDEARM